MADVAPNGRTLPEAAGEWNPARPDGFILKDEWRSKMLNNKIIGFIGSGNMGEALINGLLVSEQSRPEQIICSDVREDRLDELKTRYGIQTTTDNKQVVKTSDIIILAVKPQILAEVIKEIADGLDISKIIISIAAGVPMPAIESLLA